MNKVGIFETYIGKATGNIRYLLTLCELMDREKTELIVIVPRYDPTVERLRSLGIEVNVLQAPKRILRLGHQMLQGGVIGSALDCVAFGLYMSRLFFKIRAMSLDILQAHNIRSLLTVGPIARILRIPVIWYVKSAIEGRAWGRVCSVLSNSILFQSERTIDWKKLGLKKNIGSKVRIVRNGIKLDRIRCAESRDKKLLRADLGVDASNINVGYFGNVTRAKGIEYLIRAFKDVVADVPESMLFLVGDTCIEGNEDFAKMIKEYIANHGLYPHVKFTGWRDDALEVMSLIDICVLPSLNEGVPRSIIEAMALGRPVIGTNVGGIADLIQDGENGFLISPKDSSDLAGKLITLAKDKSMRMAFGLRGREKAFQEYSVERNILELSKIYGILTTMRRIPPDKK